eukprot:SAG11_NODE_18930_length_478_cov_0.678100_1_plen_29_part_10
MHAESEDEIYETRALAALSLAIFFAVAIS